MISRFFAAILIGGAIVAIAVYVVSQVGPATVVAPAVEEESIPRHESLSDLQVEKIEVIDLPAAPKEGESVPSDTKSTPATQAVIESPKPIKDSGEIEVGVLLADPNSLVENIINIESIVLVRCEFRTQYFFSSSQPRNEQKFNVGSGILISGEGHALTVGHVLKQDPAWNDLTDRKWEREKCDIAKTTSLMEVSAFKDTEFTAAEIVFEPSDEDYNAGFGADFALLKSGDLRDFPFVVPAPVLVDFQGGEELIGIGYPGKIVAVPQKLERFDAKLKAISIFPQANCEVPGKPCGIRYFLGRNPADYQDDLGKQTNLGIITTFFRGGFSGAPVFFRGNLVGIVTHGIDAGATQSGEDEVAALNTFDVAEILRANDILDIVL